MPPPSDNAIVNRYDAGKANGYLPRLLRFAMLKARAFLAPRPRRMMAVLRSTLYMQFNSLDDKIRSWQ